jgi:hypothetical protein
MLISILFKLFNILKRYSYRNFNLLSSSNTELSTSSIFLDYCLFTNNFSSYLYLYSQAEHCIFKLLKISFFICYYLRSHANEQNTETNSELYTQNVNNTINTTKNIVENGFAL